MWDCLRISCFSRVKEATDENLAAGIPFTTDDSLYWAKLGTDGNNWANTGLSTSGEAAGGLEVFEFWPVCEGGDWEIGGAEGTSRDPTYALSARVGPRG
jgi:hypothetical protein